MRIGVPTEVKNNEFRVAITPAGAMELTRHGHDVLVQSGAGLGSSISDAEYVAAGAQLRDTADEVWGDAEMVLKVKEPVAEEYHRIRAGQVVFTYLLVAASRECTDAILRAGATA
ncbi:MAG: alanine dehydrogenase, partial [Actinomycetota bacterium]|nr:alanine dehydrogenase [Actinomycetota bacterium]